MKLWYKNSNTWTVSHNAFISAKFTLKYRNMFEIEQSLIFYCVAKFSPARRHLYWSNLVDNPLTWHRSKMWKMIMLKKMSAF